MKKLFLALGCCLCSSLFLAAQTPDTIVAGIYLNNLYDLSVSTEQVTAEFWVWTISPKGKKVDLVKQLEVNNAKNVVPGLSFSDTIGNLVWMTQQYKAVLVERWDIRHFPFDRQAITLRLEYSETDISEVVLKADHENTRCNDELHLTGWAIGGCSIKEDTRTYKTSYGDPRLKNGSSSYSALTMKVYLNRDNTWGLFLKLFTGVFAAFLISFCGFFLEPTSIAHRISLSVGGLFAAISSKLAVDTQVPQTGAFTLIDYIHNMTFVYSIIMTGLAILIYRMAKSEAPGIAGFNNRALRILGFSYLLINLVFVLIAVFWGSAEP